MQPCIFDFGGIQANEPVPTNVRLSGLSKALILAALDFMDDRWRWTNGDLDEIEAAVSQANFEVMTNTMIGAIFPYATEEAPLDCLPCDGSQYNRVDYPQLYDRLLSGLLVDADHFVTPDLRERFIYGMFGANSPLDTGGEADVTLTEAQMPVHSHTYTPPVLNLDLESPGVPDVVGAGIGFPTQTGTAGSGQAHNNVPPFMLLHYAIVAR